MNDPAPTDALRKLALDAVADTTWGHSDDGKRTTATIPAALVERLCRLAGFNGIEEVERAVKDGS